MAQKKKTVPAKKTAAKKNAKKNEHSVVVKNALLEDEQISSQQPIECVFSDMSQRLMRIMRDLLSPAFIFEKEQIQNTVTFFGSARIKSEEVAKAELDALKKRPLKQKSTGKSSTPQSAPLKCRNTTPPRASSPADFRSGSTCSPFPPTRNFT